jgi:hypothetical protein
LGDIRCVIPSTLQSLFAAQLDPTILRAGVAMHVERTVRALGSKVVWGCTCLKKKVAFRAIGGEVVNKLAGWWVGWRYPIDGVLPPIHVPKSVAAGSMHNGRAQFSLTQV